MPTKLLFKTDIRNGNGDLVEIGLQMSDGQESIIQKDEYTLGEGEEKKEGDEKYHKIQSPDIPPKVTKIEVYFKKYEKYGILSLVIHGQVGDPLWAGPTEQSD